MTDQQEASLLNCNSLKSIRQVAATKPDIISAVIDSIEPVKL